MAQLTTTQEALAIRARDADAIYRDAKRFAEQEIRTRLEHELAGKLYVRDMAILNAVEAGVPKKRLHEVYLGTKSPSAVYEALKRVQGESEESRALSEDQDVVRYVLSDAQPSNPNLAGNPAVKITMRGDDWDAFVTEARAGKRLRNAEYANSNEATVFWLGGEEFGHEYDHAGSAGFMIDHPVLAFHKMRWAEVAAAARDLGAVQDSALIGSKVQDSVPVRRSMGEAA